MSLKQLWDEIPNGAKHLADALSVTTLLGTLAEMLPHVAALLTILWTAIRIYESATVQGWLSRRKG